MTSKIKIEWIYKWNGNKNQEWNGNKNQDPPRPIYQSGEKLFKNI